MEVIYKHIVQNFLDSYLVQRDAEKTISLVTDDIYSLGTGVQEVARNKAEFRVLIESEMEQLDTPIQYSLDTYDEKEIVPGVFTCISDVTTRIQMKGEPEISYVTRLTAGFRQQEGRFLAYHLHMSEASATQEVHEFFPLHYGAIESQKIAETDQIGLLELMKKMLPGGAMGGYVEPGFPLYFINDELLNWLGYTYEEFIAENGQMMIHTMHPEDGHRVEDTISECFASGNEYTVEYRMRKKDGQYIWVRDIGRKTMTPNGRTAMISIIADISTEKRKQQTFEKTIESMKKERRSRDRLTGLLTRGPAEILIEQCLIQSYIGAFFLMDIDNFKLVNDTKGHPIGDKVLYEFAEELQAIFPPQSVIARLGGDEFIVYYPQYKNIEEIKLLAEKVIERSSHMIDDKILADKLGVSVGIALAPHDGTNFSTLYSHADGGQYFSKRNGKGQYSFYGQASAFPFSSGMKADIKTLQRMVKNVQIEAGAFGVGYEAFNKVCQFMQRNTARMNQPTQILLFSFQNEKLLEISGLMKSKKRKKLELAIRHGLRCGDLMMDFSAEQIAVLLVNCDEENAKHVAERIVETYAADSDAAEGEVTYEAVGI